MDDSPLKDIVWREMTEYLSNLQVYYKDLNIDYNSLYFIQRSQLELELDWLLTSCLPRIQQLMLEVDKAEKQQHGDEVKRRPQRKGDTRL